MAKTEPKLMGLREYSRHRKCTHPAVKKAIDTGRLASSLHTVGGRLLIDQVAADIEWKLTTDPAQQRESDEHRKPTAQPAPAVDAPKQLLITGGSEPVEPPGPSDGDQETARVRLAFSAQRTRTAAAKAELTELELAERRGELVNKAKVIDEYYRQAVKLREGIMGVPARVAQRLSTMKDPLKIQRLLEAELTKELRSIADAAARRP